MAADPTPTTLRHKAAAEFGESWLSPGLQRYLGGAFGSPGPCAASPARDAAPTSQSGLGADARLHQTLAALQRKQETSADARIGLSAASDRIAAYQPAASGSRGPPDAAAAGPTDMSSTLAADYRVQLQRYSQQLAAKDAEVCNLRQAAAELKQAAVASDARANHAAEQFARQAAATEEMEAANAALERQLAEREAELGAATQARRAAEQAAATARAQAASAHKAAGGRVAEFDTERRYFKEQLERRDEELLRLEEALRKQAADVERRSQEWAAREAQLSATHARTHGATSAAQAELAVVQESLNGANKRLRALEADNAELRRQKAAGAADLRMLQELLADGDAERRQLHDKYVRLGERMEALVKEGKVLKSSASAETSSARSTVQEALKDAEAAVKERGALVARVRELQSKLEEEAASRSALKDKVQRKLAGAEQEVASLRGELEAKARQLQALQADMRSLQTDAETKLSSCEKQVLAFKERASALKQELENERQRGNKAKEAAEEMFSERLKVEMQAQALKYERRIQELEVHSVGGASGRGLSLSLGAASPLRPGGSVLDYIPRAEHLRLLETRLAAKESDMQLELNSRVAQLEDDMHVERQRSSSSAHKLGDETKRLGAQCLELQRELEGQTKEVARLKEVLKDARAANADMDDDALSSGRQVARLRHALDDSQGALKEAQAALSQERKRCEAAQREAEAQAAKAADVGRHCERLAGEAAELQAALEQKQELVAALQAESDAWSSKLMAHREYHEREVAALRKASKEEGAAQVLELEEQCAGLAADLRLARQQHDDAVAKLTQQHAAQLSQLETQLAAAERCSAELKEITAALGSVRQEDVETLRSAVAELQARLKEAAHERERTARQHAGQLAALAGQVSAQLAAFRSQQAQLRQQVEGEVACAAADCLASYEAGMAALTAQLEIQAQEAEAQRAEREAQAARLRDALHQLLGALRAELPSLPEAAVQVLLDGGSAAPAASCEQRVEGATAQVVAAVQEHVERAEAAAVHSALAAVESQVLLVAAAAAAAAAPPASPRKLVSSVRRQPQGRATSSLQQSNLQPAHSMEVNEGRLAALLERCRELLAAVAVGEAQVAALRQHVAALEAANATYEDKYNRAREESVQAAEAARTAAVVPLQAEVARLTERVQSLQQLHAGELAAIEAAARQQVAAAQADAQGVADRLNSKGASLQQQLRGESQRAEGLAADLARVQDELAKHTLRAASKIELQAREVEMLKGRIREVETRDAASQQELRALRQREREAGGAGGLGR